MNLGQMKDRQVFWGQLTAQFSDDCHIENLTIANMPVMRFSTELWTARQRQANALHEVAYRACFKPQLPRFFIQHLTDANDIVYDPFGGRGTTALESALLGRRVITNDINPLSQILVQPRIEIAVLGLSQNELESLITDLSHSVRQFSKANVDSAGDAQPDLSMFYHPETEADLRRLRAYLGWRKAIGAEDTLDRWVRMVATNRLTGHSPGFFSVYTLPPNQAVSPERQIKINEKLAQKPPHRDIWSLILRKSKQMLAKLTNDELRNLKIAYSDAKFLTERAENTPQIESNSVQLIVTSPPFLDVVQYSQDNWLRCWFNEIDPTSVSENLTVSRNVSEWEAVMKRVFVELFRIAKPGGWVAFEVGEIRNRTVKLDEHVVPLGISAGFECIGILVNKQNFTKTANIWGIQNNHYGTNTNRIVLFCKN
jgi:hypothetical protein